MPLLKLQKDYPANLKGFDYIVGDIHGAYDTLMQALAATGFDPEKDRLFSVGDLINRGKDSLDCLRLVEKPWFHMVPGNHEIIAANYLESEARGTIDEERRSYLSRNGVDWLLTAKDATREEVRRLLNTIFSKSSLIAKVNDHSHAGFYYLAHASLPEHLIDDPSGRFANRYDEQLVLWNRSEFDAMKGEGNKPTGHFTVSNHAVQVDAEPDLQKPLVFHGHNIVDNLRINGNRVYLDTGAFLTECGENVPGGTYEGTGHITLIPKELFEFALSEHLQINCSDEPAM
jgi:serine/threonine protein phosphatase 1